MLKRLREITGDAILVRGRNGMTPTDRGHELLQLAQQALKLMESIASPAPDLFRRIRSACFISVHRIIYRCSYCRW
jgi:DNA-binding transcriptional LysR family regulator